MTMGISRFSLPALALVATALLSGCGDSESDQRKAFIDYLNTTVARSGEQLPRLSEDQKKQFGPYANDYTILYTFANEVNKAVDQGLKPAIASLGTIRTPQDYLTQRDAVSQSTGSLSVMAQQIQAAKTQADTAKGALKQPDELKTVYDRIYSNVVTTPASKLSPVLPALQSLSQDVVQAGDFLRQQGTSVSYNNGSVQFPTQQQAQQYNTLMSNLASKSQALNQAKQLVQEN
ncbi:hypothetical protein CIG19_09555 [Enterobacterales bacterium CwR94]|nr:hypothetical protein CIG19_09555 [Enterobacterales bacterium CwR94]